MAFLYACIDEPNAPPPKILRTGGFFSAKRQSLRGGDSAPRDGRFIDKYKAKE